MDMQDEHSGVLTLPHALHEGRHHHEVKLVGRKFHARKPRIFTSPSLSAGTSLAPRGVLSLTPRRRSLPR